MDRFFGGSPLAVTLRLAVISLVVGIVLAALGLDAFDVYESVKRFIEKIYNLGFDAFEWVFRYFLLGAVLVIPIWIIVRIVKLTTNGDKSNS